MKKLLLISTVFSLGIVSCGDNNKATIDAAGDGGTDGSVSSGFHQVEHLGRPGINEALVITPDFNIGYNATAPTFAGVPAGTLNAIVGEAKTVLKALYLGGCLLNGALSLTPTTGVKPGGMMCNAVGGALFEENAIDGVTLTAATKAAAQMYADKVFAQFEPDVLRIDTSVDSAYLTLCGDATTAPLLCGGRFLTDDTIDITYNYLLNGAGTPTGGAATYDQVSALTSDGVNFGGAIGNGSEIPAAQTNGNLQQGHPAVSNAFPYSAPPL